MQELLAEYIDVLHWAESSTRQAEDRASYKALLAEAAVLLARSVKGDEAEALRPLVEAHDRLRSHSWLRGEEQGPVEQAWARVRYAAFHRAAT